MLVAMEGSVGYGIGGARVELEIGYERFKTKGIRDSGSREDEADTVYLLAKELAYDVVNSQTKRLGDALAKVPGEDFVEFAKAVEISHSDIDGKICVTKDKKTGGSNGYGIYASETNANGTGTNNKTSLCGGHGTTGSASGGGTKAQVLKDFVRDALKDEKGKIKNWPKSSAAGDATQQPVTNDNAIAVAEDLTKKLDRDEKTIVAGLLAKTIEGGEVVEIRAVSSTSVMVNACYDLLSEGLGVVPYACVGLGGNFVGVVMARRGVTQSVLDLNTPVKH
ncbi:Major surface antigen 4 precursor [Anaplasma phagocytophilum]|nr:Major surface antigen 4 precursor [Anaplasma phagocytophilum]